MAATVMSRQPFAEVGASRLQQLDSQKNYQNGTTENISATGKNAAGVKRSSDKIYEGEKFDVENVDPELFSAKKSKNADGSATKKAIFNLNLVEPDHNTSNNVAAVTFNSPTPTTASAGRSPPKPKRVSALSKRRGLSKSNRRVEAPSERFRKTPLSLDAALGGSLHKSNPSKAATGARKSAKTMPNTWFFDIHTDTADEEAANIMQHSTGILDISDDEASGSNKMADKGKENVPPADYGEYVNATNTTNLAHPPPTKTRRTSKYDIDAMLLDVEARNPLAILEAKGFYPTGLDETSVEVITGEDEEKEASVQFEDFPSVSPTEVKSCPIHIAVDEADSK